MKASANILLHSFLQPAVVWTGSAQSLHSRQCHKGPFPRLQILELLFQLRVMMWINPTLLFSQPPPSSSSCSISSCQSKCAINQSPPSWCRLCLRKCSPSSNHRMLHSINAASLCQHLTLNKEIAHTRFPCSVPSWPWAAVRRQVHKVQHMHRPVTGMLGAALPCPSTSNTRREEHSLQPRYTPQVHEEQIHLG